jgi:hypothetical protein
MLPFECLTRVLYHFGDDHSALYCGLRCGYLEMEVVDDNGVSVPLRGIGQVLLDLCEMPLPRQAKVGSLRQVALRDICGRETRFPVGSSRSLC